MKTYAHVAILADLPIVVIAAVANAASSFDPDLIMAGAEALASIDHVLSTVVELPADPSEIPALLEETRELLMSTAIAMPSQEVIDRAIAEAMEADFEA